MSSSQPISVVPQRYQDPRAVAAAIRDAGARVLTGITTEEAALAAGRAVMGDAAVRMGRQFQAKRDATEAEYAAIEMQPEDAQGRKRRFAQVNERMTAHNDGFAFGDFAPNFLFLWCKQPADVGGDSFLIDGQALLASLDPDLQRFAWEVPIDHSEPNVPQGNPQPIARVTPDDRVQVRYHPFLSSTTGAAEETAMIARWNDAVIAARDAGPMFRAEAGELICLDNYRLLHGRDAYTDPARELYSLWGWSTAAVAIPVGELDLITPDLRQLG